MKEGMMRVLALILVVSSLLAAGCAVLMEDSFNQREAEKEVGVVINGALKADADGEVVLPARCASVSRTGKAYVTHDSNGSPLILFPTWQGKGQNIRGYVYSSRPITK